MSRKKRTTDGGRAKREAARVKIVEKVRVDTDAIIDRHMPYLLDLKANTEGHNDAALTVIKTLEKRFTVTQDYKHARSRLARRVVDYNKTHDANLAVPPALTRDRPLAVRRTQSWCERRRQINEAHETLMQALDDPLSPKLDAAEQLGLSLYFASALGGMGDHRALSALRLSLTQTPEIYIHRGLGIAYIWVRYVSRGACNAFIDDELVVFRPWIIPTAARIPLLGYLGAKRSGSKLDDDEKEWALIRRAYRAVVGKPYPKMTFRQFCRTASAIYERQQGVDVPEVLVQIGNGQVECLSPPPDQWDSFLQEFAYTGSVHG
jgi:hypothetical protein